MPRHLIFPKLPLRVLGSLMLLAGQIAQAALPDGPPALGLYQSRSVLDPLTARQLESWTVEHENLTGEKILLLLFPLQNDAEVEQELNELLNQTFLRWKLDSTRRGANVAIIVRELPGRKLEAGVRVGPGVSSPTTELESEINEIVGMHPSRGPDLAWKDVSLKSLKAVLLRLESPVAERAELPSSAGSASLLELQPPPALDASTPKLPRLNTGILILLTTLGGLFVMIGMAMRPVFIYEATGRKRVPLLDYLIQMTLSFRDRYHSPPEEARIFTLGGVE